jgi:hypothetical protein
MSEQLTPDLETIHHQAMELFDRAVLEKQQGNVSAGLALLKSAFEQERSAADLVADQFDFEPTWSILHRSAATIAVECALLSEAERLTGRALSGNPPADIADELRDLLLSAVYSPMRWKPSWDEDRAGRRQASGVISWGSGLIAEKYMLK